MIPGNRPGDAEWDNLYEWVDNILNNAGLPGSDAQVEQITNAIVEKVADVDRGGYTQGRQEAEMDFQQRWEGNEGGPVYFTQLPEFMRKDLLEYFAINNEEVPKGELEEFARKKCEEHDPSAVLDWWMEWHGMVNWAPRVIQAFMYISKATSRPPQSAQPVVDPCFLKGDAWWFSLPDNDEPQGPFPSEQEARTAWEKAA